MLPSNIWVQFWWQWEIPVKILLDFIIPSYVIPRPEWITRSPTLVVQSITSLRVEGEKRLRGQDRCPRKRVGAQIRQGQCLQANVCISISKYIRCLKQTCFSDRRWAGVEIRIKWPQRKTRETVAKWLNVTSEITQSVVCRLLRINHAQRPKQRLTGHTSRMEYNIRDGALVLMEPLRFPTLL